MRGGAGGTLDRSITVSTVAPRADATAAASAGSGVSGSTAGALRASSSACRTGATMLAASASLSNMLRRTGGLADLRRPANNQADNASTVTPMPPQT